MLFGVLLDIGVEDAVLVPCLAVVELPFVLGVDVVLLSGVLLTLLLLLLLVLLVILLVEVVGVPGGRDVLGGLVVDLSIIDVVVDVDEDKGVVIVSVNAVVAVGGDARVVAVPVCGVVVVFAVVGVGGPPSFRFEGSIRLTKERNVSFPNSNNRLASL